MRRNFTEPVAPELVERVSDGIVMQMSGASRAAASAANLVRAYGIERTEREIAELLGTTKFGTSPAQVMEGLGKLAFSCAKAVHADLDPRRVRVPAVLLLPPGAGSNAGHAVLLAGLDGDDVLVLDPLAGRQRLTRVELGRRWKGHAVECERRR
jgi:ABC-type bacteriocin/lantibiotic exporter with double-glycine peptidase domain